MALTLHVEIDAETGEFKGALKGAEGQLDRFGRQADRTSRRSRRAFDRLRSTFTATHRTIGGVTRSIVNLRNLLIVAVTAGTIRQYTRLSDAWALMHSRLKLVTQGQEDLRRTSEDLLEISQDNRTVLRSTVDLYISLARSQNELEASQRDLLTATTAITQSLTLSGASADSAAGALFQLSQAFGDDIVRAEEFNSLIDGMPALLLAVADSMGITRGELRRMVVEGRLTARQFFQEILNAAPQINRQFQEIERTGGQALTQLQNEFEKAIGLSAEQSDATREIVGAIDELREVVADPRFQQNLASIVTFLIDTTTGLANLIRRLDELQKSFEEGVRGLIPPPVLTPEGFIAPEGFRPPAASIDLARVRTSPRPHAGLPTVRGTPPPPPDPDRLKAFEDMRDRVADLRFEAELLGTGVSASVQEAARAARAAGLVENFEEIVAGSDDVQASMVAFAQSFEAVDEQEGLAAIREQLGELRFESDLLAGELPAGLEEAARAARGAGLVETFEEVTAASGEARDTVTGYADAFSRLRDQRDAAAVIERTRTEQQKFNDEIARLEELKPHLSVEQHARAVEEARSRIAGMDEDQERLNDAARRFGFTFASSLEDAAVAGADFQSLLQGLLEDLQRMILRLTIIEPLARSISTALSGGGAGGGGAAGGGAAGGGGFVGFVTSLFAERGGVVGRDSIPTRLVPAGAFVGAPHLQGGGVIGGGVPAIVHRGEEILPSNHPRHINNAGGGGVEVNVFAPPGTRPQVQRRFGPGGQLQLDVVLDEAVATAVRRPGSATGAAISERFAVAPQMIARG